MPLGLGIAKGASYVNDWEKDIDRVYQRAEYAAKIQTEKERKTAYYAELLKKGHATNPRTETELNDFYKGLNDKLATFFTENPNFETDIDAMQKFRDIQDQYLNNDILRRDLQVGQEFEKLKNAVATQQISPSQYEENMARYKEYIDPANVGKDNPFVFINPKLKETSDILKEIKDQLAPKLGPVTLDAKTHMNYQEEYVPYTETLQAVKSQYADPDTRMVMDRDYQAVIEEGKKNKEDLSIIYPDAVTYYAKLGDAQNKQDRKYINQDLEYAENVKYRYDEMLKKSNITDYYQQQVMPALNTIKSTTREDGMKTPYGVTHADNASVAFTVAQELKKPFFMSGETGVLIKNEKGVLIPWDKPIKATMLNVTEHRNVGGVLYAKGTFSINIPEQMGGGADEGDQPVFTEQELRARGFESSEVINIPIYDEGGKTIGYRKGREWTGEGLFPEIHNDDTKFNYNKLFTGSGELANKIATTYGRSPAQTEGSQQEFVRNQIYARTGKDIGQYETFDYDPDLSNENKAETYVVKAADGKEYALNGATGELKEIIYK